MTTASTITRARAAVPAGSYGGWGANTAVTFSFGVTTIAAPISGTYVMGEYWSLNSAGWTLTSDVPAFSATASSTAAGGSYTNQSINGLMVDPGKTGGGDTPAQGFTSLDVSVYPVNKAGMKGYDPTVNFSTGKAGPLMLAAGVEASLVKAFNLTPALVASLGVPAGRPVIQQYEILTVVAAAPSAGAFRPGPSAPSKVSWLHTSDINYARLPRLSQATLGLTIDFATITRMVAGCYQVWFTSNTAGSRNLQPYDNHPEYGRDIGYLLNDALCAILSDADLETQIKPILHGFMQIAVDICDRIATGGVYIGNGGGDQWRLMPLLVAYALTKGTAAGDRFAAALSSVVTTFSECDQITFVNKEMQKAVREFVGYALTLSSGGSGYTKGDILTDHGGDFVTPVQITVSSVNVGGAITGFSVSNTPDYRISPSDFAPTGGSGTGATFYTVRPVDAYFPFMIGSPEFLPGGGAVYTNSGNNSGSSSDYGQYREVFGPDTPGWLLALTQFPEANALINYPALLAYCKRYWYMWRDDPQYGNRDSNQGMHTLPWATVNAFFADDTTAPAITDAYLDAMITPIGTPIQAWVAVIFDRLMSERATAPAATDFAVTINGIHYTVDQVRVWGYGVGLRLTTLPPAGAGPVNVVYTKGVNPLKSAPGTAITASFTRTAIANKIGLFNPPVTLTPVTTTGSANSAYATYNRESVAAQNRYTMVWKGIIASGVYGSLVSDRSGSGFNLFVNNANGTTKQAQLRFYFMASGKVSAKPFTVPCDEMITIGLQVDLTQSSVAGIRGFYKREGHDAVVVAGPSMTQPFWGPGVTSFETSGGIGSGPMGLMAQGYGGGRLAGSLLYFAEAWTDSPGALYPDFSNLAVCNACDFATGTANVDGSQMFAGTKPQGFYAASSSTEANALGLLNRGTAPTSDADKNGTELFGPTVVIAPPPVITATVSPAGPYNVGDTVSFLVVPSSATSSLTVTGSSTGAGTWAAATQTLPANTAGVTFSYTLGAAGLQTITFTNSAGLLGPLPFVIPVNVVVPPPPPPIPPVVVAPPKDLPPYAVGIAINFVVAPSYPTTTFTATGSSDHAGNWAAATQPIPAGTTGVTFTFTPGETGPHSITFTNSAGLANPAPLVIVVGYPTVEWVEGDPLYTDHGGALLVYGARAANVPLTHRGDAIAKGYVKPDNADPKLVTAPVKGPNKPPVGVDLIWATVQPNPNGGSIVTNFVRRAIP